MELNKEEISIINSKGNRYYLKTIKDVVGGDELTVKYTFYTIPKEITESERLQEELEPLPFCPMADD